MVLPSAVGLLLVLYGTSCYGPGMSSDSIYYVSVARSLAAGKGYVAYDGDPAAYWPPLLPVLLALPVRLGIDPLVAFRYLNAFAFAGLLFVSGLWLRKQRMDIGFRLAGSAAILLGPPLLTVAFFAWSEPLFICCLLWFLYPMDMYLKSGRRTALLLATVFAALSCLARFSGVTVILTGVVLLLGKHRQPLHHRFLLAGLFGAVSALPIVGWCLRNRAVTGTLAGERGVPSYTLIQNLRDSLDTLSQWFLPPVLPPGLRAILLGALAALLCLWTLEVRRRTNRQADSMLTHWAGTPLCFCLLYALYLPVSAMRIAVDRFDDRLWSPLYAPLVWCALSWIGQRLPSRSGLTSGRVAQAGVGLWLGYLVALAGSQVQSAVREGAGGYSTVAWHQAALIVYLRQHPPKGILFSNAAGACYLLAGLPAQGGPEKEDGARAFDPLRDALQEDRPVYLLWFRIEPTPDFYSDAELRARFKMSVVMALPEGTLYRFAALPESE